jgi:hypothetical protein
LALHLNSQMFLEKWAISSEWCPKVGCTSTGTLSLGQYIFYHVFYHVFAIYSNHFHYPYTSSQSSMMFYECLHFPPILTKLEVLVLVNTIFFKGSWVTRRSLLFFSFFFFRNRWAKKRGKKTTRCWYSVIIKSNVSISISFQQWCFNPYSIFIHIWDEKTSKVQTGNSHHITQLYI